MNFNQLRYTCEISKCNSFNKAAKSLGLSQSTLSKQIMSLENELGFEIFERSSAGTKPTKKGTEFIGEINSTVENFIELQNRYSK